MADTDKLDKVKVGRNSTSREAAGKSAERTARDRSYGHRSLVKAWKDQQEADRALRGKYANILIKVLIGQVVLINLFFAIIGFKVWGFETDKWLAHNFILTSFLEICSLVLIVAKYLFPPATDKALDVISGLNGRPPRSLSRSRGSRTTRRG
jgi:hypothetical protein